ncbi:MAG: cyclophilin-like fold protein [Nitrospira sp.]|nr:cyclophilin-like fold protein [Nitrospira sp.]
MTQSPKRIRITIGPVRLDAELKATKTANQVYAALPIQASVNTWGEEFYFKLPGVTDHRETATNRVQIGDVAYWGPGQVLAIFFGKTPMSIGDDPVPADRVNVVGRILGDATQLRRVMDVPTITVEQG